MRTFTKFFAIATLCSPANSAAQSPYVSHAPIAYLVDMASGTVLVDKQSSRKIPPASMTKMMTAYVAFEQLSRGKLKHETQFTVRPETWKRWNNTGSTMFLKANEKVRIADLLHGVVTLSGNDAAIVLAEGISGSEPAFVKQMNATAAKLGMRNSHFGTANGWPDGGRTLTTAHDLALLGERTIRDFPALYREYYGQRSFRWNNVTQPNRNPILSRIAGADGVKTGHTDEAGYCFTGTAEQNGRRVMMVIAGLPTMDARAREAVRMMRWGFEAWRGQPLFKARSVVGHIPVQMGTAENIAVIAPRNLALVLPVKDTLKYKLIVRYRGPVRAPIRKGDELAELVAKFSDGREQAMPLLAREAVAKAGFLGRALNGLKSVFRN